MKDKFTTCQQCKGKGYHNQVIKDLGTLEYQDAIVSCMFPGCHNGKVDVEENYRITNGE